MNYNIKKHFHQWQNEPIFSYKYGNMKRKDAIHIFIKEGYIPFITKKGYIFSINMELLEDTIASMIFINNLNEFNHYNIPNNNYYDEHYIHYSHIISYDSWCNFMNYWEKIFNELFCNNDNGSLLPQLIIMTWEYIHLEKSSTYIYYIEDNSYDTDTNNIRKELSIDPYIIDQMNRDNHHKFTKFEL